MRTLSHTISYTTASTVLRVAFVRESEHGFADVLTFRRADLRDMLARLPGRVRKAQHALTAGYCSREGSNRSAADEVARQIDWERPMGDGVCVRKATTRERDCRSAALHCGWAP